MYRYMSRFCTPKLHELSHVKDKGCFRLCEVWKPSVDCDSTVVLDMIHAFGLMPTAKTSKLCYFGYIYAKDPTYRRHLDYSST